MVKRHLPKYVSLYSGKYLYFKHPHTKALHRMPDDPSSTAFAREYARLRSGHHGTAGKRSVKALIANYTRDKLPAKAKNTQTAYRRAFRYIEEKIGAYDVATIKRSNIVDMQNASADKPATANRRLEALSVLLTYAVGIEWIVVNPAIGVPRLKSKRPKRTPWPANFVAAARETAEPDTLLLFEMLIGTGQRISDVLAMQWSHVSADGIAVTQTKTSARLVIPLTSRLSDTLAQTPRRGLYIVSLPDGRPMAYQTAWKRLHDLRTAIGAEAYDNHALRYTAAAEIAALPGMTLEHVRSITGHTSDQMARLYSYDAHQIARAREAQKGRK